MIVPMNARSMGWLFAAATLLMAAACTESVVPDASTMDSGGGDCTPACGLGRDCCGAECANLENDPRHCGTCGTVCGTGETCTAGACETTPCTATCTGGESCCGAQCCATGQICCDPQGPVSTEPTCVTPDERGTCPVGCAPLCMCAAPDTPIATPDGERPIASLRVGDLVFSVDGDAVVAVPIVATHQTPVSDHRVVRVTLDNGVTLEITGGHPTADGRTFADLFAGSRLGDLSIAAVEEVPYAHPFTYDILPGSSSGTYFAGGALIGSTLAR